MEPPNGSERMWLKQAIQFSLDGQVHTVEITVPAWPGASSTEIEQLLQQADVSLDQMTEHLLKRIETLQAQLRTRFPEQNPTASGERPSAQGGVSAVPMRSAPFPAKPPSGMAPRPQPGGASSERAQAVRPGADGGQRTAPPGSAESLGSGAAPRDLAQSSTTPPLDRKQFITESAVLGLNPRQAMERLGVRSLDGLNLSQALEQLRQQLLRERAPLSGEVAPPNSVHAVRPWPERAKTPEAELEVAAHQGLAQEEAREAELPERKLTRLPLRGVQDLASFQERARAQALLERLRKLRGRLSVPGGDQVKAFRNVVESQLGAALTTRLLEAVWHISTPEHLNTDQMAECIRWGKSDQFAEEVELVLGLIGAEEA